MNEPEKKTDLDEDLRTPAKILREGVERVQERERFKQPEHTSDQDRSPDEASDGTLKLIITDQ